MGSEADAPNESFEWKVVPAPNRLNTGTQGAD